jgi:hypothetical protein
MRYLSAAFAAFFCLRLPYSTSSPPCSGLQYRPMRRPRFQFSIRWVLVATAAVAIWAGLWVADPNGDDPWWLGLIVFAVALTLPALCGVALFHSTGGSRAFWFGSFFVLVVSTLMHLCFVAAEGLGRPKNPNEPWTYIETVLVFSAYDRHFFLVMNPFAPVVGLLCAGLHWLMVGRNSLKDNE